MTTRLLLVTDAVGGVWVYSLELARALAPLGIEAVLAVTGPSPNAEEREAASGIRLIDTGLPLEWLDTTPDDVNRAGRELARLAAREDAALVQTSSAALLAEGAFGCPCIAVQHSCVATWWAAVNDTPLPRQFEWRRDMVARGLHRAAAVVAPSIAFAAETARTYDVPAVAVHNGRRPLPSPDIPRGDFVFTAGRLWDEGKNPTTLDSAAARLEVPFQAAGATEGPNGASITLQRVEMLGQLSKTRLAGLYAARPIYASAALYEPFGLSVLEAAQAGCALVLSDIATHREMWGGAAIFVPARDAAAFAGAIRDLLDEPDERDQLGQLARTRALHYSPERMARGMTEIYARALSAEATSAPMRIAGVA